MPDTLPTTPDLGAILLAECLAQGLDRREASRLAGVAWATGQRVFSGRYPPKLDTLLALLGALGRDLVWLHGQGVVPPAPQ